MLIFILEKENKYTDSLRHTKKYNTPHVFPLTSVYSHHNISEISLSFVFDECCKLRCANIGLIVFTAPIFKQQPDKSLLTVAERKLLVIIVLGLPIQANIAT